MEKIEVEDIYKQIKLVTDKDITIILLDQELSKLRRMLRSSIITRRERDQLLKIVKDNKKKEEEYQFIQSLEEEFTKVIEKKTSYITKRMESTIYKIKHTIKIAYALSYLEKYPEDSGLYKYHNTKEYRNFSIKRMLDQFDEDYYKEITKPTDDFFEKGVKINITISNKNESLLI